MWTLVTGGAKGLGAALCIALAKEKHRIAIHYRTNKEKALEVAKECRSLGTEAQVIQGDFSSPKLVEVFAKNYLQEFSDTIHLVNNVGNYFVGSPLRTPFSEWLSLYQVNLLSPVFLSQFLADSIIRHQGQIINIGTAGLTKKIASTYATAYMMTKEGLWSFTRSLAKELAPQRVRVNMVSPGELVESVDHHSLPMHRPAYFEEICRVVTFLLAPESSYITGQNIEVAGGLSL